MLTLMCVYIIFFLSILMIFFLLKVDNKPKKEKGLS